MLLVIMRVQRQSSIPFLADIILNFRTAFVNKKGEVVQDTRRIAKQYLRGWFLLDFVAALPFDLLYASELSELASFVFLFGCSWLNNSCTN